MFPVDVSSLLWIIILAIIAVIFISLLAVYVTTSPLPDNKSFESENYFKDPNSPSGPPVPFPKLSDAGSLNLSVVIPAYDEEKRLPPMLDECLEYLEERKKSDRNFTYEVIIVDDGSKDQTTKVGLSYCKKHGTDLVRVLRLEKNRGKGGAVKMGMFRSRGKHLLFADADGATKFPDFQKLESAMKNLTENPESDLGMTIGSRAHLEEESIATRSAFRTLLMHGFHFLVWLFCVRTIRDTQCGFKLISRETARICFSNLHIHRWAFDVELLYIAEYLRVPMQEIPVRWTEIDGSKIVPFWSWLQMGKDLLLLWLRYRIGVWKVDLKPKYD